MSLETLKIVISQGPVELLTTEPAAVLDVRGLVCPFTSLKTVQGLGKLTGGQLLEVITSDASSALETIPAVLRRRSLPFAVADIGDGSWIIRVQKPAPPGLPPGEVRPPTARLPAGQTRSVL